jgi:hypothetical protein
VARAVPVLARERLAASPAAASAAAGFFLSVMSLPPEVRPRNRVASHARRAARNGTDAALDADQGVREITDAIHV